MQRINTLLTDYSGKSQTKKEYIKAEPYIYICIDTARLASYTPQPLPLLRLSPVCFLSFSGQETSWPVFLTHSDDNARALIDYD